MSVIAKNGRHEDDLLAEARQNEAGNVKIGNLLEHLELVLGDPECGYGDVVHRPVRAAAEIIRMLMKENAMGVWNTVHPLPAERSFR